MNYWHLLLDLPAVIGGSSMLSLLSPWRMQTRVVPLLLFVVGLVVLALPTLPVVALALMLPAAWIQQRLGIDLAGHEAADYSPAVQKARSAAQFARERVRKPKPVQVQQFATKAYPSPEDAAELGVGDADMAEDGEQGDGSTEATEPEPSPAESMQEKFDQLVKDPRMPASAGTRLMGQRAGRDRGTGIRDSASRVPQYVPAL